jgi:uncharacterized protein (TIGR03437 family)
MKLSSSRVVKRSVWIAASLLFVSLALAGFLKLKTSIDEDADIFATRMEGEEEHEGERREDWFYRQRAYPAKIIPANAGSRMVEQLDREEARMRDLKLRRQAIGRPASEPDQQLVWAALGPQPILNGQTFGFPRNSVSGRISAIALDPRYDGVNNQTLYVGGAQGGVWKSTDNGANWTPITDGQPSIATGAIAIDPRNPETVYAGTGEGNRCALCYYGAGLLKSTNGGATWTVIAGPPSVRAPGVPAFPNTAFSRIEIDPTNSSTLFVATAFGLTSSATTEGTDLATLTNLQVGVWKSTDAGATWRNVDPGETQGAFSAHDVVVDPRNPNRVFAGLRTIGLFRSEQGGEPGTWQLMTNGLPDLGSNPQTTSPYRRAAFAVGPPLAPSTNTTFYVAMARSNSQLLGIFRSTDNGNTWTQVTNPAGGQANYNLDIQVDPGDANILYYATSANSVFNAGTLYRSTNGGQSWTDITLGDGATGGLHADTHQIAIAPSNPNIVFTGNDGGMWRTANAKGDTVVWNQLNNGLNVTQFMGLSLHPTDPNIIIGGTQDNGTNRFVGALAWDHIADGDGGFTVIDQSNPRVMYHTFFNQSGAGGERAQIGPRISLNGGNSWERRGCFSCSAQQGGFNPTDRVAFYAPMAQNTGFTGANGNVVYFGTHRLYRTADRGAVWIGLGASADGFGADLTTGAPLEVISAIAGHPQVSDTTEIVWVGTSDGQVQVTTNAGAGAGATFSNVTKAPLPNRVITDIALDPANTQRAFVVYSGFNLNTPATPGHVFTTTNRGQSWQDISGNLPDVPVTSIALNPTNANTIYIGTDLGVFQTTDGGATWARLGNGMPRVATFMVRYHAASNSLVAATHGRGMFRLTTARAVATVSAANFSAASISSESIVAAFGTGLATQTASAATLPLPISLAGSRVSVRDSAGVERLSPLFFVSAGQINFQIPPGTANGAATVTITSGDGAVSTGAAQIVAAAPSLFAQNANGQGVPAGFALRIRADNSQQNVPIGVLDAAQNRFVPTPIDLGPATDQVFLVLFGTGIRFRSALSNVTATIGGVNSEVLFAGAQGALVGLDQINLRISRNLIGRGEVDVALVVDGRPANLLRVNIR